MPVASIFLAVWMHLAPPEQDIPFVPVTLIIVAVLMAVVVWWLLKQTINVRPWEGDAIGDVGGHAHALSWPAPSVGVGVLLAVVTSLFALFISAYFIRMSLGDWSPTPEPWLLWLNTAVLIATSVAFQWTRNAARDERVDAVWAGLLVTGGLTGAFLIGQLVVWQQLTDLGYFAATNPANAFFYLLTALHGLHLVGGLVAWGRTTGKVWRGIALPDVRLTVELCAVYWHYLLLVWVVLFGLLLAT